MKSIVKAALIASLVLAGASYMAVDVHAQTVDAKKTEKLVTLLGAHRLRTSVAFGNRYLKQQSLAAARDVLTGMGKELKLGREWRPGNAEWDAAEAAMTRRLMQGVERDWTSMAWLSEPWTAMTAANFSDAEIDALVRHFSTDIGRKQAQIIDQAVSFHMTGAYTMSDRLIQDYPGTAEETKMLTYVYAEEDQAMRFSVKGGDNVDGQRFALSDLGAKYQKTLVIKLTGILNQRVDGIAKELPAAAWKLTPVAEPFAERFRAGNPG